MAKKKSGSKINYAFLAVAVLGLVLTIVGMCIPWFTGKGTLLGGSSTTNYGIFENNFAEMDFPFEVVQSFGFIAVIFAAIVVLAYLLKALKVVKFGASVKFALALINALFAILAMVFAFVFLGQFDSIDGGSLISLSLNISAGAFLVGIGGLITSVGFALQK